jgi:hypothetical protein
MPRTIINGNGWYLFGIADDQEIQKVVSSTNPNNELSDYIVANHSADVEYAYVVQKHNPVRAWIKKRLTNHYRVYTNSLLGGGEKFYVEWFDGYNNLSSTHDDIDTLHSDGRIQTEFPSSSSFDELYSGQEGRGGLKVTVTKKDSSDNVLEVLTASLEPLVVYGTTKGTSGGTVDEKYWTGEVNGELFAHSNTVPDDSGTGEFRWYRKPYGGGEERISGEWGNVYTIQGDDASKEIIVKYGKFPTDSEDPTSNSGATATTDNAIAGVATYQSIGAASDPFANNNWQRVFFPSGPQSWKNTTNSTLGVWVKIINFFDTVAPIIDTNETVQFVSPVTWDVIASDNTAQYIDIPFSKELRLPHHKLSDFSITVTDARIKDGDGVDGTNDISDQISKYDTTITENSLSEANKRHIFSPSAVAVGDGSTFSNKILRLTLPHRQDGSNYYPYVFEEDTVSVSFTRTDEGTILKDTSAYDGTTASPDRSFPTDSDYYGGYDKQTIGYGNLVVDFNTSVDNSSSNTDRSTFDNKSPTISSVIVTASDTIKITFNETIANGTMPANTDFAIKYEDYRSDTQKGGGTVTWSNISTIGKSSGPSVHTRSVTTSGVTLLSNTVIQLTLDDHIYRDHTNARHRVYVSYTKPDNDPLTDNSDFKNKVNTFELYEATNSSELNNTYPTLNNTFSSSSPSLTATTTETDKNTVIVSFEVNGPSDITSTTDWTLVETTTDDKDNFYINDSDKTKIVTNSASASIKIKYKPNFSYTSNTTTMLDGWTTTENGLDDKSYTFKLQFSVAGVNGATGETVTTLTTTTPTMSLTVSSSTVKTERTKALIKANTVVNRGNIVLFWDKHNGDVGLGPFNGLTSANAQLTGTPTFQETGNDTNGLNVVNVVWDGYLDNTTANSFDVSLPNSSWFVPIVFDHGKRINGVQYATNAPKILNTKYDGKTTFTVNDGGNSGNKDQFNPKLGTASVNQGKYGGGAAGNFGWYENENENPFLSIRTEGQKKFRLITLAAGKRDRPLLVPSSFTSSDHTRIIQTNKGTEVLDQSESKKWKLEVINV